MKKKYYLAHQTLGRLFICPIVQATKRIILEIDGLHMITQEQDVVSLKDTTLLFVMFHNYDKEGDLFHRQSISFLSGFTWFVAQSCTVYLCKITKLFLISC